MIRIRDPQSFWMVKSTRKMSQRHGIKWQARTNDKWDSRYSIYIYNIYSIYIYIYIISVCVCVSMRNHDVFATWWFFLCVLNPHGASHCAGRSWHLHIAPLWPNSRPRAGPPGASSAESATAGTNRSQRPRQVISVGAVGKGKSLGQNRKNMGFSGLYLQ